MLGLLAAAAGLARFPKVVGFEVGSRELGTVVKETGTAASAMGGYHAVVFRTNDLRLKSDRILRAGGGAERVEKHVAGAKAHIDSASPDAGTKMPAYQVPGYEVAGSSAASEARYYSGKAAAVSGGPARLVRTTVEVNRVAQDGDAVVTEWVVVRAWQGADGSRVVLTTAELSSDSADSTSMGPTQARPVQLIYPYTAVPVRDGWLVFQL